MRGRFETTSSIPTGRRSCMRGTPPTWRIFSMRAIRMRHGTAPDRQTRMPYPSHQRQGVRRDSRTGGCLWAVQWSAERRSPGDHSERRDIHDNSKCYADQHDHNSEHLLHARRLCPNSRIDSLHRSDLDQWRHNVKRNRERTRVRPERCKQRYLHVHQRGSGRNFPAAGRHL